MWLNPKHEDRLDRLMEQLRLAPALTADLISNVVADACTRLPVLNKAGKASSARPADQGWRLERRGACSNRARTTGMEASSPCL